MTDDFYTGPVTADLSHLTPTGLTNTLSTISAFWQDSTQPQPRFDARTVG